MIAKRRSYTVALLGFALALCVGLLGGQQASAGVPAGSRLASDPARKIEQRVLEYQGLKAPQPFASSASSSSGSSTATATAPASQATAAFAPSSWLAALARGGSNVTPPEAPDTLSVGARNAVPLTAAEKTLYNQVASQTVADVVRGGSSAATAQSAARQAAEQAVTDAIARRLKAGG